MLNCMFLSGGSFENQLIGRRVSRFRYMQWNAMKLNEITHWPGDDQKCFSKALAQF